jgi:uncharacterized small protein (DUF1192 family)
MDTQFFPGKFSAFFSDEKVASSSVTLSTLGDFMDAVAAVLDPLHDRIAALEAEVIQLKADLETRVYRGVWQEGQYERGNMATRGGSLWHCEKATRSRPGADPTAWKLIAKNGAGPK